MTLTVASLRTALPEYADPSAYPDTQVQGWLTDAASLRLTFPEFTDPAVYPDAQLAYWFAQAQIQVNAARFGTSYALAKRLFVAHNIVLAALAAKVSATGVIVGTPGGIASSKSVGSVSVSYDTKLTAAAGGGFWNATQYGQRYWTMLRAFVSGPQYVVSPRAGAPLGLLFP